MSTFQRKFDCANLSSCSWDISKWRFYSYWWPDILVVCCCFCTFHICADSLHLGLFRTAWFVKIGPLVVEIQAEWSLWHFSSFVFKFSLPNKSYHPIKWTSDILGIAFQIFINSKNENRAKTTIPQLWVHRLGSRLWSSHMLFVTIPWGSGMFSIAVALLAVLVFLSLGSHRTRQVLQICWFQLDQPKLGC